MIFPKIFWYYCILILQVMCRDPPSVKIKNQGTIMGMFIKSHRTSTIVAYLGVPYAHPPLGMLRFRPPIIDSLPSWEGVRNGSISQPNCYQNTNTPKLKHTMVLNKLLNKVIDLDLMMMENDHYDEDCLYLNIYVPAGRSHNFCSNSKSIYFRPRGLMHFCSLPNVCLVHFLCSFSTQYFYRFQPLNSLILPPCKIFICT